MKIFFINVKNRKIHNKGINTKPFIFYAYLQAKKWNREFYSFEQVLDAQSINKIFIIFNFAKALLLFLVQSVEYKNYDNSNAKLNKTKFIMNKNIHKGIME